MTVLTGLTDFASLGDGSTAVLYYCNHTSFTSTAPAAECFTVVDGKIVEIHLVFDRMSSAPITEKD